MEMEEKQMNDKMPPMFKPAYEKEEVEELLAWFEKMKDKLPQELRLDAATVTKNLPFTVERLMLVLRHHKSNMSVTFSGYVALLMSVRKRLEEQGI